MKNNCPNSQQLQEYVDRCLPAEKQEFLTRHLNSCAECKRQVQAIKQVFNAAKTHSRKELEVSSANFYAEQVMGKIIAQNKTVKPAKEEKAALSQAFSIINFKWLMASALTALLIVSLVFLPKPVPPEAGAPQQGFNLANNRLEVVIEGENSLQIGDEKGKAGKIAAIPLNQPIKLSTNMMIMVEAGKCRISLSNRAVFSLSEKQIKLASGKAVFNLSGSHQGFVVKTPFAEITPLGTKFSLEVKKHFVKVELSEGEVKVVSKSGIIRPMSDPGQLFVDNQGHFSADFSQQSAPAMNLPSSLPATPTHTTETDSESPARILDSF